MPRNPNATAALRSPVAPSPMDIDTPTYELRLAQTLDATGYFMPVPKGAPDFRVARVYLEAHPYDEFMHRYALEQVLGMASDSLRRLVEEAPPTPVLTALLLEAAHTRQDLAWLQTAFRPEAVAAGRNATPLIVLRAARLPDRELHRQWIGLLRDNLLHHRPLSPAPEDWPAPVEAPAPPEAGITLADVPAPAGKAPSASPGPSFDAVYRSAVAALEGMGILEEEMRHESSLSPVALLRRWRLAVQVDQDRHRFRLSGLQTAYGKGLSLERARASCAMEIVERVSAFASVVKGRLPDTAADARIARARLSDLQRQGVAALDPNTLALEVPYHDQSLYWIAGERAGGALQVPFQTVYLFANLDEISLFSGLGSTGLAAGSTLTQAKFHALLECIERDAEALQPFDRGQCFRLATRDDALSGLLAEYRRRGIDVFFQDCRNAFGVPCYKCFVYGPAPGAIAKGTSAHFAGWQAALAALTETPYPFPHGPGSRPGPEDLPVRFLEALPDYASDDPEADLQRLETLLAAHGFSPVYVNLTRRDLAIPVVRALIPGLELMADFDCYSRVGARLYRNYRQQMASSEGPRD